MPHYRIELHSHCKGDPVDTYLGYTLFQHIDRAKEAGLDAIAVTWHRKVCAVPEAFEYARERNVLLISGMEAEIKRRHLVVLNLAEGDLPGEPTWNQVRALRLRKPEVLVLAPHPFYPHPSCLNSMMNENPDCIDAVEWCGIHVHWIPAWMNPNLRAARWAQRHGKTLVACSDAHSLATIGRNASVVEADELSVAAVMAGVRAGRVTFERRSLAFGPLVYETSKAMVSQVKYFRRWIKTKLGIPHVSSGGSPVRGT